MSNEYMRQYMAQRRAERRQDLLNLASSKCIRCGSMANLEFDHRDPTTRRFLLSGKGLDGPWSLILNEFSKCDLLCDKCHHQKTKEAGESGGGHNKILDPRHGSVHMYMVHACRCTDCRFAKMLYRKGQLSYSETAIAPIGWRRGLIRP